MRVGENSVKGVKIAKELNLGREEKIQSYFEANLDFSTVL